MEPQKTPPPTNNDNANPGVDTPAVQPQDSPGDTPAVPASSSGARESTTPSASDLSGTAPSMPEEPKPAGGTDNDSAALSSTEPIHSVSVDASPPSFSSPLPPSEGSSLSAGDATPPVPAVFPPVEPSEPADLPPAPLPVMVPRPRRKGLIIGGIIAVVVFVLLGGASAAYYYVANKPENILLQALANSLDETKAETMHLSGSLSTKDAETDMELKGTFTGAISDKTGAMDISGKLDVFVTNATFDLRSLDGKTWYVKLGGLSGLPELLDGLGAGEYGEFYSPLIATINDQWFEINESLTKEITGGAAERLTKAERETLAKTYQQHAFLVVKDVLADETIKGTESHHYKVVIDKAKLQSFAAALKQANIKSLKIADEELEAFNKSIQDAKFENFPVDLWIAKDGKMITQMAIETSEDGTTSALMVTVESYNKPVTVEKPEGAKSILDIMGELYSGLGGLESGMPVPGLEGLDSSGDGVSL